MTLSLPIYMDNHATTPVDPRVLDAMMPYFTGRFGNAASRNHSFGWAAEAAVSDARDAVAALVGARSPKEIVFTSGATESDNLAIKGVAHQYKDKGARIVTCKTEHKAVLDTCKRLEREGFVVTYLDPDTEGRVTAEQVKAALTPDTILVSLMWANNEIGTVHPIAEIGAVCRERGVFFHCDAVQGLGTMKFDADAMNADDRSRSQARPIPVRGSDSSRTWVRSDSRSKRPAVRSAPPRPRSAESALLPVVTLGQGVSSR